MDVIFFDWLLHKHSVQIIQQQQTFCGTLHLLHLHHAAAIFSHKSLQVHKVHTAMWGTLADRSWAGDGAWYLKIVLLVVVKIINNCHPFYHEVVHYQYHVIFINSNI